MRGRVIFLLFSLLLLGSSAATAQCNFQFDYSAQFRASFVDIAVDGNDLWAATVYGVQLFDRTVEPPRLFASLALPGTSHAIEARDGTAFVGSGSVLHAVRRADSRLQVTSTAILPAQVNDLQITGALLYAATAAGIQVFEATPAIRSRASLTTSTNNVLSLTAADNILYAADGDSSVERWNVAGVPASLPALTSLSAPIAANSAGGRIFISDGQQTDIFASSPSTRIATLPYGATSLAGTGDVVFLAGNDRRFRAFDISAALEPVELFSAEVIPTGGTVNRVTALSIAGESLYVAGGDTGLFAYDLAPFRAPYPYRSYPFGAKTSAVATPTAVYVSNAGGGITELTRTPTGNLLLRRTWATAQPHVIHDFDDDFLITSSGATLTEWTVRSTTPTEVSTATFRAAISGAVKSGSTVYALLVDGSVWSANLGLQAPTPVQVNVPAGSLMARSDAGIAIAQNKPDATTDVRFYPRGNLAAPPVVASVDGVTPTLAVGESRVAVFTFRGITTIDFSGATPQKMVLPLSTTALVRDLAVTTDSKILAITASAVRIWSFPSGQFEQQIELPGTATSIAASNHAAILTESGVVALNYTTGSRLPVRTGISARNDYYRKAVASSTRLYLFDGSTIHVFETGWSPAPHWTATIPAAGVLDLAASETALFTLSGGGMVVTWSLEGVQLRSVTLNEGADATPLAIHAVNGAPWVSISRGCLSTGCEKKTIVFDPQSLVQTAALTGGVIDVSTAGTTAYALFDLPSETRTYRVSDALHPSVIGSRASEPGVVAVAGSNGALFALGTRLYEYPDSLLTKTTEHLESVTPSPGMKLRIDGGCAVITGRSGSVETFTMNAGRWTAAGTLPLPANARSVSVQPQRLIVLTDYSVELWSRGGRPAPGKRRAVR
ncbi:MAG: hypothetical protein ABIO78_08730 [Thermoanaerobaculia bacterium]